MSIVTYSQLGRNGRLGNQLFQIAATVAYGIDHGKRAVFPHWDYARFMNYPLNEGDAKFPTIHKEPAFTFSEIPEIEGDVDLHGYFQSEKYFERYRDHILRVFKPSFESLKVSTDWFKNTMRLNNGRTPEYTCSLHVRRGDYEKNENTKQYHGLLGMDYYEKAIQVLPCDIDEMLFYIVSDDPDWCEQTLDWIPNKVISRNSDIMDLFVQSFCNFNIIANSSFSWWGHWLNQRDYKICVAPKQWFANGPDPKDVYPKNSIVI